MVSIERGSDAWRALAAMCADPNSRRVSIDIRAGGVAVKVNEDMWTPTLATS